jgi:hypothetical protein
MDQPTRKAAGQGTEQIQERAFRQGGNSMTGVMSGVHPC